MMPYVLVMMSTVVILLGTQLEFAPQDVDPCYYDSRDVPSNEFLPRNDILTGAKSIRVSVWRETAEGDKRSPELAQLLTRQLSVEVPEMAVANGEAADLRVCVIVINKEEVGNVRALVWVVDCRGDCTPADEVAVRFCTADYSEVLLVNNLAFKLGRVLGGTRSATPRLANNGLHRTARSRVDDILPKPLRGR